MRLADVALELVVPDGPMPPGIAHLIERLPPAPTPGDVAISYAPVGPPTPERPADLVLGRLSIWVDAPDVHVRDATGATAQMAERLVAIGGGGEQAANGFHALFLFALTHLLAHRDLIVLHGAGVVRDGRAFLLLGGSGSGKSTLAVAALEAGWGLLADDMVVIRRDGERLEATGVPRAVLVPSEHEWTVTTTALARDARGRLLAAAELLADWFPLEATVAVGHASNADGALRPLPPLDVFAAVRASFVSGMNPPLLRRFLPTAAALSRRPGWALDHGSDPRTRRTVAAALLTAVARGRT